MNATDWTDATWALVDESDKPLFEFTSFIDAEIKIGGKVVSEAVEKGSFASYNKTKEPVDIYVTVAVSGDPPEIGRTLDTLRALQTQATLFRLLTPEAEFRDMTLESYDYKRDRDSGLNALYISLHLVEVEQVETLVTGLPMRKCRRADHASSVNTGQVNPRPKSVARLIEVHT